MCDLSGNYDIFPSPTARSAVRRPKAREGEGTNLDVRGVLLHAWRLERKLFALCIYLYINIHGFRLLKNAVCKLRDWYVVDQTILRYLVQANRFGLVLFFPCMEPAICLHYLNTEAIK